MQEAVLTQEEKDYIDELCQESLAYICDHMNGMSENMLSVYLDLKKNQTNSSDSLDNQSSHFNKMKTPEFSLHDNLENNNTDERDLCYSNDESKREKFKSSFFIEMENIRRKKNKAIKRIRGHLKNKTDNRIKWLFTFQSYNLFKTKIFVQEILKENEGNCRENTSLTYPFLFDLGKEKKCSTKIKIVMFKGVNFDHAFYALGNFQGCDFRKWPEDTMIYDPWLREKFPLKDMPYHWCEVAYSLNWGGMRKWPNVEKIMTDEALLDENHLFFSRFKFQKYLGFTTKPMLIEEYVDNNESENIIEKKF